LPQVITNTLEYPSYLQDSLFKETAGR